MYSSPRIAKSISRENKRNDRRRFASTRCHNRKFLLRFARDRDVYRKWLREGVRRHGVPIYGFCMVRAGVVSHPREWRWCGYDELSGARSRYRLLDLDRLLESLGMSGLREFRETYIDAVERRLAAGQLAREAHWTEPLAVGSRDFVGRCRDLYVRRWEFDAAEAHGTSADTWTIREPRSAYGAVCQAKTQPKSSLSSNDTHNSRAFKPL